MVKFEDKLREHHAFPLKAAGIDILQVNLGYRCNMACRHCHVNAGPGREEMMSREDIERVVALLRGSPVKVLDITGGAPELNPHFRYLVSEARRNNIHVIVRSNLTIFFEKGMEQLPEFYQEQGVEVIASLPYYRKEGVDRVRGSGAFGKSITALRLLNKLGFSIDSTGLRLNLVFNPQGAFLPPAQEMLETEYKRELKEHFGITFDHLYAFTNMPIGRFRDFLVRTGNISKYMEKLACSFNTKALDGVMCRHLISIGWDGRLYDCDFNQMIGLTVLESYPRRLDEFDFDLLSRREIALGDHCYGCTAGQGST